MASNLAKSLTDKHNEFKTGAKRFISKLAGISAELEQAEANKEDIEQLKLSLGRMKDMIEKMRRQGNVVSQDLEPSVQGVTTAIKNTLDFINDHENDWSTNGQILSALESARSTAEALARLESKLDEALRDFNLAASLSLTANTSEIRDDTREIREGTRELRDNTRELREKAELEQLHSQFPAVTSTWERDYGYEPCLEGTREKIIDEMVKWAKERDPTTSNVLWLHGMAGCGKTSTAHSVAERLVDENPDGSVITFFFRRRVAGCDDPNLVFSVLARDLSQEGQPLRKYILAAVKEHKNVCQATSKLQITRLLVKPMQEFLKDHESPQRITILWDGLDECGDPTTRRAILTLLANGMASFAPVLQFIIASRPEPDIMSFMDSPKVRARKLELPTQTSDTENDIRRYIAFQLEDIRSNSLEDLPPDWPGYKAERDLVERAAGVFIWARTAMRFLSGSYTPVETLGTLLSASPIPDAEGAVDQLYKIVLENASKLFTDGKTTFAEDFRRIIGAIVLLYDPLTMSGLESLLQDDDRDNARSISTMMKLFASVIAVEPVSGRVRLLHKSFQDFLLTPSRCSLSEFVIHAPTHHFDLAVRCLRVMRHGLTKKDICKIGNPPKMNTEIPDLRDRLQRYVPEPLRYAGLYWAEHLSASRGTLNVKLREALRDFLYERLFFWMELLSLAAAAPRIFDGLRYIEKLLSTDPMLHGIALEALLFDQQSSTLIGRSAAHIYLSALAWTPKQTQLYKMYFPRFCQPSGFEVLLGYDNRWSTYTFVNMLANVVPNSTLAQHGPTRFSHTGKVVITCHTEYHGDGMSQTGTIEIFDPDSGRLLHVLAQGCTPTVTSLDISNDEQKAVTGHGDSIVRLWDLKSGTLAFELSTNFGHCGQVSFTPDGCKVLAANFGATNVEVWDALTGQWLLALSRPSWESRLNKVIVDNKKAANKEQLWCWDLFSGKVICDVATERFVAGGSLDTQSPGWNSSSAGVRFWAPAHKTPGQHEITFSTKHAAWWSDDGRFTLLRLKVPGLP